jgi:hypothetical protein
MLLRVVQEARQQVVGHRQLQVPDDLSDHEFEAE